MIPSICLSLLAWSSTETPISSFAPAYMFQEDDVRALAINLGELYLLKSDELTCINFLSANQTKARTELKEPALALGFSKTASVVVLVDSKQITAYESVSLKNYWKHEQEGGIGGPVIDDHVVAFRDSKNNAVVFDLMSESVVGRFPLPNGRVAAVSSKAKLIALHTWRKIGTSPGGAAVEIWSYDTKPKLVQVISDRNPQDGDAGGPGFASFSPSGRFFAYSGFVGSPGVWDLSNRRRLFVPKVQKGRRVEKAVFLDDEKSIGWINGSSEISIASLPKGNIVQTLDHFNDVEDFVQHGFILASYNPGKITIWFAKENP